MKLDKRYLLKSSHDAIVMQYADMLRAEGYSVECEKAVSANAPLFRVDLYAEKSDEKRIYDFKVIGDDLEQEKQIQKFKSIAEEINALPFVVYVTPPTEKTIEIDDFGDILFSYFTEDGIPNDLGILSSHTMIDEIEIDELTSITISSGSITVAGDAIIYVILNYGSGSDDEFNMKENFPMTFTAVLASDLSIDNLEYKIDISDWHE